MKIKINITEGTCSDEAPCPPPLCSDSAGKSMKNAHYGEEARMHRTTLAHLMADVKVLLDLIQDGDDLPEWLEAKITKAGDYMSSAARYISGDVARDMGQLEEDKNCGCGQDPCVTYGNKDLAKNPLTINIKEHSSLDESILVEDYYDLYESLQDAVAEDGTTPCPECLYESIVAAHSGEPTMLAEAEYKGRKVKLNKRMRGDVKKFKVFVKGCGKDKSRVKKINFGDKNMKIKKSNPKRRKSFRARHKCATAKDKCTARYWSCKAW